MERSSKLAPLTLVSKYYPAVANYSYPRSEGAPTPCNSRRPSSSKCWSYFEDAKRSSVHSQESSPLSSPPSLVDDRTDSEASTDVDDYRYRAHADELWDTFWMSGQHQYQQLDDSHKENPFVMATSAAGLASTAPSRVPPQVPEKDYPALISSPQRSRRRPQGPRSQGSNGWPLSDQHPRPSHSRKPSPTYSAFPKIASIPSPASTRPSSSSQLPTGACEDRLSGMDAHYPLRQAPSSPPPPPPASLYSRPGSPRPRAFSPASLKAYQRPATSHGSRPSSPMDYPYPSPPPTAPLPALPVNCPKAPHLTHRSSNLSQHSHAQQQQQQQLQPLNHTIRPYKSTTQLRRPPPEPLPVSVFEYDSDTDCTDDESSPLESPALSFFRFHRRSQSPRSNDDIFTRRRGSASKVAPTTAHQSSLIDAAEKENCKRRKRNNTIDSLPRVVKQSDVFSRMLGLRSR
ncbi:hypothetical protein MKX08_006201 [Trichoderma sp. CBMAI-0020]|nr:hypothetical protein MKX08_006201 [Trichoderma sp. CBMAI-0020]